MWHGNNVRYRSSDQGLGKQSKRIMVAQPGKWLLLACRDRLSQEDLVYLGKLPGEMFECGLRMSGEWEGEEGEKFLRQRKRIRECKGDRDYNIICESYMIFMPIRVPSAW